MEFLRLSDYNRIYNYIWSNKIRLKYNLIDDYIIDPDWFNNFADLDSIFHPTYKVRLITRYTNN